MDDVDLEIDAIAVSIAELTRGRPSGRLVPPDVRLGHLIAVDSLVRVELAAALAAEQLVVRR